MLGKTAAGLFWMSRYLERSETGARLVEVGQRMALTRSSSDDEWASVLNTAGVGEGFQAKYGEAVTRDLAIDWMLRDRDNPSSVLASIEAARTNARVVRTALTREVWEAVNESFMTLKAALARRVADRDLSEVLALIRARIAFVRGAMNGTMMRDDRYNFCRLGTFVERADNTARILDVKYYVLLPSASAVGSSLDTVQWETILRSVSAEGSYRHTMGQRVRPRLVAQFLIFDQRMPRSLMFCAEMLCENLDHLAADYGLRGPAHDIADALRQRLKCASVDSIFDEGLHDFLQDFQTRVAALGQQTEMDYRFSL
ncbi:alpha-E domain-containing protein [Pseudoroseicyclus aestuarii]|uniref:alpha-E domain-containing protein n=1 Tax=Pseudoroseicyclus aestuarii TaxID=1795041 RepID=UPI000DA1D8F2|nr:alpha-E domain-containing protein [Pseudoroseicyclus aestuarii]